MPARRRFRKPRREQPLEFSIDAWLSSRCSSIYCTTPDAPVTLAPDPYDMEIHGDETPVWLCASCRHSRYMEI